MVEDAHTILTMFVWQQLLQSQKGHKECVSAVHKHYPQMLKSNHTQASHADKC